MHFLDHFYLLPGFSDLSIGTRVKGPTYGIAVTRLPNKSCKARPTCFVGATDRIATFPIQIAQTTGILLQLTAFSDDVTAELLIFNAVASLSISAWIMVLFPMFERSSKFSIG